METNAQRVPVATAEQEASARQRDQMLVWMRQAIQAGQSEAEIGKSESYHMGRADQALFEKSLSLTDNLLLRDAIFRCASAARMALWARVREVVGKAA